MLGVVTCAPTGAHGTGKTSTEEKRARARVPCGSEPTTVNLTCEDKQFSFLLFFPPLSDFMDNVTRSYADFVSKTPIIHKYC